MPAERFTRRLNEQIGNELAAHNQYLVLRRPLRRR